MTSPQQTPKTVTSTARTLSIVTAVVGGGALLAVAFSSAFGPIQARISSLTDVGSTGPAANSINEPQVAWTDDTLSVPVDEVQSLRVDAEAVTFDLAFGDVENAELTVEYSATRGSGAEWSMHVEGRTLVAERLDGPNFGPNVGEERVKLVLPQWLSEDGGIAAELTVSAATLTAEGDFSELSAGVEAGRLKYSGSTPAIDLEVSGGKAQIDAGDVRTADIVVEAGDAQLAFTGDQPDSVDVEASVGKAVLELPKGAYRLEASAEVGAVDNQLTVDESSQHRVQASAEAARIVLRETSRG